MKSIALYDNLTVFLILNTDKNIVKMSYFDYLNVYFGFVSLYIYNYMGCISSVQIDTKLKKWIQIPILAEW